MNRNLLVDLAVAPVAGYLGAKAMEPVSTGMYERESQADREREDAVRPGPPYRIPAQKTTALAGVDLTGPWLDRAALVFHYGLAVSWAPTYALLRRRTGLGPVAAGLLSGAAMSAIVDAGLTPALGFSAPNRAYPASAHVRGVVAHLAFGLAVAGVTEAALGPPQATPVALSALPKATDPQVGPRQGPTPAPAPARPRPRPRRTPRPARNTDIKDRRAGGGASAGGEQAGRHAGEPCAGVRTGLLRWTPSGGLPRGPDTVGLKEAS